MITTKMRSPAACSDAELVSEILSGNRDAFGEVVARYQTLVCSLAYSACGDIQRSEELAQETFVTAWRQLRDLREPEKLKSWLAGIARNLINNFLRKEGREPSHKAGSIDEISEAQSPDPRPTDEAIDNEELAILWRTLERIPDVYREPLILFYREHQSVEAVAQNLDLTEDAVKQRLSRGRKLLQYRMIAFVEGALARTNPGKVFTVAVLAALPGFAISAKAATLGASAAKGSAAAKTAVATGLLGTVLSPLLAFFGMWVGYRMNVDNARSDKERDYIKGFYRKLIACIVGFAVVYFILMCCAGQFIKANHLIFVSLVIGLALAYTLAIALLSIWSMRKRKRMLSELSPDERAANPTTSVWEYRSPFHLLGLPFIHIRIGERLASPIKAWIAMGDCAIGVLFAFGGLAVAPISIGGCAVGLVSFGGMAIGALALGGFASGAYAFGGMAVGWQAFGGCALAWDSAYGGVAIARSFALGSLAQAMQTNNEIAGSHIGSYAFFRYSIRALPYIAWMNLIWILPLLGWWRVIVRRTPRGTTAVATTLIATLTICAATAQQPTPTPAGSATPPEQFDDLVRDDFFDGEMNNDRPALDRAMKLCEDTLAKNPKDAQAMVWHGSGALYLAGLAFRGNDTAKGIDLWQSGLKQMDDAVALDPDSVSVLIPQAATLVALSKYDPNPDESRQLLNTGVTDYEKVLTLQVKYFQTLSTHARGELLFSLADGWYRLGNKDKSQTYLRRIVKDLPNSDYAARATDWLQTTDDAALQRKSRMMSCIGCHTE